MPEMVEVIILREEIAAIRAAITSGARKVVTQTNGVRKEVEYPSFADLLARLRWLEAQCPAAVVKTRLTLAQF